MYEIQIRHLAMPGNKNHVTKVPLAIVCITQKIVGVTNLGKLIGIYSSPSYTCGVIVGVFRNVWL